MTMDAPQTTQIIRVVLDGVLGSHQYTFERTLREHVLPQGESISIKTSSPNIESVEAMQVPISENVLLQVCVVPESLRSTYLAEFIQPIARTVLGAIVFYSRGLHGVFVFREYLRQLKDDFGFPVIGVLSPEPVDTTTSFSTSEIMNLMQFPAPGSSDKLPPITMCNADDPADVRATLAAFWQHCKGHRSRHVGR